MIGFCSSIDRDCRCLREDFICFSVFRNTDVLGFGCK